MRARSSTQAFTLGPQNQWMTTLPAASFIDGTSYSQSRFTHVGLPVTASVSPATGIVAGGSAGFFWAEAVAAVPRIAAQTIHLAPLRCAISRRFIEITIARG